jgi:hypothetical protein
MRHPLIALAVAGFSVPLALTPVVAPLVALDDRYHGDLVNAGIY